mgnify:CR=1 FL=1
MPLSERSILKPSSLFALSCQLRLIWDVEIAEAVGKENMFIFGLSAEEILEKKQNGYLANRELEQNGPLAEVLDALRGDLFSKGEKGLFEPLYDSLVHQGDYYMVLADFADYCRAQKRASELYRNPLEWTRKAILNVAGMGPFSCDNTVRNYADNIWGIACPSRSRELLS